VRPVDQVRTGWGRGQCTEATIASLLEVELGDVPDLWSGVESDDVHVHRPAERWSAMLDWLDKRFGLFWLEINWSPAPVEFDVARLRGVIAAEVGIGDPLSRHHGLCGISRGGVGHMVVGLDGRMVHDPNPWREGLTCTDGVMFLLPRASVPERWLVWPSTAVRLADHVFGGVQARTCPTLSAVSGL
jgi:hypothetical protein